MLNENLLLNEIQQFLYQHNCPQTYLHNLAVGEYAGQLAKKYTINPEKARVAGYLHDISAIYPVHERIHVAQQFAIPLLPAEIQFPLIIHQKISTHLARYTFGITDEEILSAIGCHTTLKANYSPLDLVVFVADKIKWDQTGEPPYLTAILTAASQSLEAAARVYIDYLLHHELKVLHPWLEAAYKELQNTRP